MGAPMPPRTDTDGLTSVLAAFAAGDETARDEHEDLLGRILVDTVGSALASAHEPAERILQNWAAAEGTSGRATVWTTGRTASAATAALLNGTAGHQLDYDDISPSMPIHPSTVIVPALLAVAEQRGTDTRRLVQAYDVGAAVFRAVADLLPQHVHYARGWHTTSTVGRLAAVAAVARLVEMSSEHTAHALGIVASMAAGSRPNFGSMTKPLHAGLAARDAVTAVDLAEAGFTANPRELEADAGFFDRYGDPELAPLGDPDETLAERLEYWLDAWPTDWGIKRYPACYGTHRSIDASLALRERIAGAPIREVRITVHPRGTRALVAFPPTSATAAKFSAEYAVSVALQRGAVVLADFTEDAFAEPETIRLMNAVSITESAEPPAGAPTFAGGYSVVEVVTEDGARHTERVDITRGDGRNPLSDEELRDKFDDCCATGGLTAEAASTLHTALVASARGGALQQVAAALAPEYRTEGRLA
ncbi:MmgE/PrpD family protein [Rhodococcus sp. BUPNP1]|uniref:MmgE/PrpD family protein n=1 Tax=Rhodococcus sp. BUPNP1 TaxID=1432786 RepID=UPI000B5AA45B|nr:MmgE/PrpD family protein [Rhodococcus sp. BUPNP1]OWY79912.1 hypothetical protein B9C99_20415 [Rhodococcus sp. BUPNP1]